MNCFLNEVRGYADLDGGRREEYSFAMWQPRIQNIEYRICEDMEGECHGSPIGRLHSYLYFFWHNQVFAYRDNVPPPHMLTSVLTRRRRNRIRFFETSSKNPISCLSLINQMLAGMQIVQVRKTPDLSPSGREQKTHTNVLLYQIRTTGL